MRESYILPELLGSTIFFFCLTYTQIHTKLSHLSNKNVFMIFLYLVTEALNSSRSHYKWLCERTDSNMSEESTISEPLSVEVTKNKVLSLGSGEGVSQLSEVVPEVARSRHKQNNKDQNLLFKIIKKRINSSC